MWPRAVERAYRAENAEQHRCAMDQQYRDTLNNLRDDKINAACEAEAEREVRAVYDSSAEVSASHAYCICGIYALRNVRMFHFSTFFELRNVAGNTESKLSGAAPSRAGMERGAAALA